MQEQDYTRFLRDNLSAELGQTFVVDDKEYSLEGKIGDGAIGVVRKARDHKRDEVVAVKFLAPELKYIEQASLSDIHTRFRREGLRGVSLYHDNLVTIIAYEDNENGEKFSGVNCPCNPFLVMEFVRGRTLENFIRMHGPEPTFHVNAQTLHIAYSVVNALVYLHDRRIVHRDVKPANIYLSKATGEHKPSIVKLGDFGVVKWGDFRSSVVSGSLTMSGHQGLGTYKYMSPEQAIKPKDVNVRSDMYSLGITLFELFTGQILQTPHHVSQLTQQRLQRSSITTKLYELGLGIMPNEYHDLFLMIYDMMLPAPASRPSSQQVRGRLSFLLERLSP